MIILRPCIESDSTKDLKASRWLIKQLDEIVTLFHKTPQSIR